MERIKDLCCLCATTVAALLVLAAGPIAAQSNPSNESRIRGNDYTGAYGQLGLAVGKVNFDHSSSKPSGGLTVTGGYRFLPWLSAEGNFTYMGGGDVERHGENVGKADFFAFTLGPKIYPLGFTGSEGNPHFFQPYATIGIGGGKFDAGDSRIDSEGSFVARFLLGFDVWATNHFGFFVEGGGHAASESHVEGVGLFSFGSQYRF